jgi:hypothetical protein
MGAPFLLSAGTKAGVPAGSPGCHRVLLDPCRPLTAALSDPGQPLPAISRQAANNSRRPSTGRSVPSVQEGAASDPERSPALARRASAVVRSADAGIRFVLPYGQKESLDPDNPSLTSGCRPCWKTRRSKPYPTWTPWPNRNPSASSTIRCSGSRPPSPLSRSLVAQETRHSMYRL